MSTKSFAQRYNKVDFQIDTTGFNYVSLSELYNDKKNGGGDVIRSIDGLFISKSTFGDAPVFIDVEAKQMVNIPTHMTSIVRDILQDAEAIEMIKAGKVGYTIYEYVSHGKKCYSVSFIDK